MINKLPDIRILRGPSTDGVPYPPDADDETLLTNPDDLRQMLGAQEIAKRILPCIDTRTSYWRYFLFAVPGRQMKIETRLYSVLRQTAKQNSIAGIGRREYRRIIEDGRRSSDIFIKSLKNRYQNSYGTAASAFWGSNTENSPHYPGAPSVALCAKARDYIKAGKFVEFFNGGNHGLRRLFNVRLKKFRPGLAGLIIKNKFDLLEVAKVASRSRKIDDEDRILIFTWSLLQAYYGIADNGLDEDVEDYDEQDTEDKDDSDDYYRKLAKASLDFLENGGFSDKLNSKQINSIRSRLKYSVKNKGDYQAPVRVWKHRGDGTRRRIFASLRLYAFTRLLEATEA